MSRRWHDARADAPEPLPSPERPFGCLGAILVAISTAIAHHRSRRDR